MVLMSLILVLACLWVLAATLVAFLPMRLQYVPGSALLLAAPVLLVFIALEHGVGLTLFGLFAVLSLFRRPLLYYWRKAFGSAS